MSNKYIAQFAEHPTNVNRKETDGLSRQSLHLRNASSGHLLCSARNEVRGLEIADFMDSRMSSGSVATTHAQEFLKANWNTAIRPNGPQHVSLGQRQVLSATMHFARKGTP